MREILFRGKRFMDGEFVDGSLFIDEKKDKHEILVGYVNYRVGWEIDPKTVGQFTGLTDKNGKKIFEGDIIEWDELEWGSKYREAVTWDYSLLAMRKNDWGEWCEVIGNIHDNPDLLKVGAVDG